MTAVLETFLSDHPSVRNVELVLIDPSGIARGKWAPVATLKKAFGEGVNFPLSLHGLDVWGNEVPSTGLHIESGDLDGFCRAVPSSLSAVPWSADGGNAGDVPTNAQVLLTTLSPDGAKFGGCARTALEQVLARLSQTGLSATCAFELEFHLLRDPDASAEFQLAAFDELPDAQFMYGLGALAEKHVFFGDVRRAAEWAGLPIDTIVKEAGPGQFEVNLNHREDALRAADDAVLLKRIIQQCARRHGLAATFMAKPFAGQPGNGMHIHASLIAEEGNNIFATDKGLALRRHAVAGLLDTMVDMTLVFINSMNGFRRMAPGSYAPTRINWGENNRSVAVRLPASSPAAHRIEHRVSGADANPYLVLAAVLGGMMAGMEAQREAGAPLTGNAYDDATPNRGDELPATAPEALAVFEKSAFARQLLGEAMHGILCAIKRSEHETISQHISRFERRTYL